MFCGARRQRKSAEPELSESAIAFTAAVASREPRAAHAAQACAALCSGIPEETARNDCSDNCLRAKLKFVDLLTDCFMDCQAVTDGQCLDALTRIQQAQIDSSEEASLQFTLDAANARLQWCELDGSGAGRERRAGHTFQA